MPTREELRSLFKARTEGLERYEARRRTQPSSDKPLSEVLAWVNAMLDIARSQGPIPQPDPEEKARRVRLMHQALSHVRR